MTKETKKQQKEQTNKCLLLLGVQERDIIIINNL